MTTADTSVRDHDAAYGSSESSRDCCHVMRTLDALVISQDASDAAAALIDSTPPDPAAAARRTHRSNIANLTGVSGSHRARRLASRRRSCQWPCRFLARLSAKKRSLLALRLRASSRLHTSVGLERLPVHTARLKDETALLRPPRSQTANVNFVSCCPGVWLRTLPLTSGLAYEVGDRPGVDSADQGYTSRARRPAPAA